MMTFQVFRNTGLAPKTRWLLSLVLLLPMTALASAGKVVIAQGEAYALDPGNEQRSLARRSEVNEGDTLVTGADGRLQIRFNDNAVLALSPDSRLRISEYRGRDGDGDGNEQVLMDLLAGGFRTITGSIGSTDRDAYQVRTPNASIGVRGTHYEAVLSESSLLLGVYDGGIVVNNESGSLNLGLGDNFLFAEVGPSSAPRGLLEPPAGLNRPNVPDTGQSGQPAPEDEPEAQLENEEEEGLSLEQAFAGNEPPPTTPRLTDEQQAETLTSLSELGDELSALGEEADNLLLPVDARLTADQQLELTRDPDKGFVVLTDNPDDDAVRFVYAVEGDNGPVFINYDATTLTDLDDGYVSPDRVYKGPAQTDPENQVSLNRGDQTVEWGIWNASADDPATLLESSNSLSDASLDKTPFFYVLAEPADLTALEGTRYLNLCSNMDCINVSSSNGETLSSADGYMDVNLDDLGVSSGLNLTMSEDSKWSLYFSGDIDNSLLSTNNLFIDYGGNEQDESSYTPGDDSGFFTDLSGEFQGVFINSEEQGLEFVGGFGVSSGDADQSISGVFIMSGPKEEQDLSVGQ